MSFPPVPASYRPMTISSGLRAAAQRDPGKTALILGDERRSYAQVVANVNRTANLAAHLGLKTGDNAAVISPNSMEYLEIVAGISDLGVAVATPNPRLTADELTDICNDAKAKVLFVHPDSAAQIDRSRLETVEHVVWLGEEYEGLKASASDRFAPSPIAEWATFSIPYTSGTTGKPKGVMLSHRSRTLGFFGYATEYGIYSPDDHFLALTPMCHGAGFAFAFAALFMGGTAEIMPKFDPEAVIRAVKKGEITGMFTVPTHYHGIFALEETLLASQRGNRLRGIVANAAPLSQDAKERIVDYFGDGLLHETYGSTEAGVVTNLRPKDQLRKVKCVGLPFVGNEVRLLDDGGREVGPGEVGELFSNSPCLFNGYWGNPTATEEAFRDGFVSVGDLAMRDEEGFIYIVDRKKDMVISGGMNIYPRELETVINGHPGVRESAVIGAPDPRWGEQLIAYLVLESGRTVPEDMLDFCKARLAPYKLPKVFIQIDQLPRNANGKVLKTTLRALFSGSETP